SARNDGEHNDEQTLARIPAARFRPSDASTSVPRKQEGTGNAGCSAAPMARLQQKKQAAVTTGPAETSGIPCAMVLRLIRDLLGVPGLLASVAARASPARLDPSVGRSGPHDFAVRTECRSPAAPARPSHPVPTSVAIGQTPLQVESGWRDISIFF